MSVPIESLIERRARELAATGEYKSWLTIEMKLRSEGYPQARRVLDQHHLRRELDALCQGRDPYDV